MPRPPHRPKLPKQLLGEIGQEVQQPRQKSQQFSNRALGRKQARKEKRQFKKHGPQGQLDTHGLTSKEVEEALALARAKKEKGSTPKRSKQDDSTAHKKRRTLDPESILNDQRKESRAKDEEDAYYYAKMLGLKSLKLPKGDDGLDELLGDFDVESFGSESDRDSNESRGGESNKTPADSDIPWSSDDSISDGDFDTSASMKSEQHSDDNELPWPEDDSLSDSDFDNDNDDDDDKNSGSVRDTMEALQRIKASKGRNTVSSVHGESDGEPLEGDMSEENNDDSSQSSQDENGDISDQDMTAEETLLALKREKVSNDSTFSDPSSPSTIDESEDEPEDTKNPYIPPGSRYVPPSQRKRQALENDESESEVVQTLKRQLKGSLNKLAESNMGSIVNEVELYFQRYPRGETIRVLTETIIASIGQQSVIQENFFITHAGIVGALYRTVGMEFCAEFIQTLVEKVESLYGKGESSRKEALNVLLLLVECYALGIVSSMLMYGLVRQFVKGMAEKPDFNTELLLSLIRHCGSQLRSDDPGSLKSIILMVQESLRGKQLSERTQFLVDCIVNLKNNRQKPISETVAVARQRIRKFLGSIGHAEPLQVSLEDILSVPVKGKWWIVGAAWRGHRNNEDFDQKEVDSLIDNAEPDWLELAKQQRLNTDVRRAIFVALMGAENFLDACQRIDKLGLRSKQEREVVHVLLHCCATEETYNPYYALVATKQCTRHSIRKTFQFRLWDFLGQLEGTHDTRKVMHYGRFYASLVADGALTLDLLKNVDILTATGDLRIFIEIFLITLYQKIGKYAEVGGRRSNALVRDSKPSIERNGQQLAHMFSNTKDKSILRGIKYIQPSILDSPAAGSGKSRQRIEWCVELASGLLDHLTIANSDDEI